VTAPTSTKCQITATSSRASFGASGGAGVVTVSADRDCEWAAQAAVTWIAVDGPASGQGGATINFGVSANGAPTARKGDIVVAGTSLEITQDAAPCRYSLDRSAASLSADGGSLTVMVSTLAGCSWSVAADAGWLSIATARPGNGSGSTQITVAPNAGSSVRTGRVTIADQAVVVSQQGRAVTPPSSPTPPPPPSSPNPSPTPTPPPSPTPSPAPAPPPPSAPQPPPPTPPPDDGGNKDDDGGDKGKDPKHDDGKDKDKGGTDEGGDKDGKGKDGKGKHVEGGVLDGNAG
jgi:BACON domain-containing protein